MTTNGQLALMELEDVWEPGLPMSPGALDPADQQQLLWGYPDLLWTTIPTFIVASAWQINSSGVRPLTEINTRGVRALADINTRGIRGLADINSSGVRALTEINTDGIKPGV